MNIVIMGGGRLGYYLAKSLLSSGYKVRIIEEDKRVCEKIASSLDTEVCFGDGTRLETLARANTGKCDVFIAVTGRDEDNLVACEIAKMQFHVKRTICKSNNNKNASLMRKLGVDIVLDTTKIITRLLTHEIDGAEVQFVADIGSGDAVISEYSIPLSWSKSGSRVSELFVPEECVLVYVKRSGVFMIPRGNTVLMGGDEIIALTVGSAAKKLKKLFEI